MQEDTVPIRTVWIYVDVHKSVGDADHIKVFASRDAPDQWFKENDPEGVVFEYEVVGKRAGDRRNECALSELLYRSAIARRLGGND